MDEQFTRTPLTSSSPVYASWINPAPSPCQSTHPLGMRHFFPRYRIRSTSGLMLLRRYHQSSLFSVSIRLSSPTQPNTPTATMLHLAPPSRTHQLQPCSTSCRPAVVRVIHFAATLWCSLLWIHLYVDRKFLVNWFSSSPHLPMESSGSVLNQDRVVLVRCSFKLSIAVALDSPSICTAWR
jgi:hypothetical protein